MILTQGGVRPIVSLVVESSSEHSVRRYWNRVWSQGNVVAAREFYAPTFRLNGQETSVDEFVNGAEAWLCHFSEFDADVQEIFTCGSVIVSRVVYRATHTGDFKTVPARGMTFELSGIDIFEFREARVTCHWHETDHLDMFQQLGAEPRPIDGTGSAA